MREKLYIARLLKRLTLEEMGEMVGISYATYRRIEQGGDVWLSVAKKICEVLGEDFADIFLT